MMKVPNQDRQWVVILSAAKNLSRRTRRFFAALRMTALPILVGNLHHRVLMEMLDT